MPHAAPVLDSDALFQPLDAASGIVLAVSGGPDSTALMHLVARWRVARPALPLWVASVDHGLRDGSDMEAQEVVRAAQHLSLDASVLTWQGAKPTRAVQEKARQARYRLLTSFAKHVGATHLVTAHTLDDQAETLLFRMARGSGLGGLGGMKMMSERDGIFHIRPFLTVRKQELLDLCAANDWSFVDDPANADVRFARARWRRLAPALATEGLTPERLGSLARRLARAESALCQSAESAAAACTTAQDASSRHYRADMLFGYPFEVVSRVIGKAVMELTGDDRLRLNRLERLLEAAIACHQHQHPLRRTLHNCLISLDQRGFLVIEREGPRQRGYTC